MLPVTWPDGFRLACAQDHRVLYLRGKSSFPCLSSAACVSWSLTITFQLELTCVVISLLKSRLNYRIMATSSADWQRMFGAEAPKPGSAVDGRASKRMAVSVDDPSLQDLSQKVELALKMAVIATNK